MRPDQTRLYLAAILLKMGGEVTVTDAELEDIPLDAAIGSWYNPLTAARSFKYKKPEKKGKMKVVGSGQTEAAAKVTALLEERKQNTSSD